MAETSSEAAPLVPGPRQTVDRVRHPMRGEGRAVSQNGPSWFQPDGGVPIRMHIGAGGAGERGSWRSLRDPDFGLVEATILVEGETHSRMWSPMLGAGWLVHEPEGFVVRFEPDVGAVVRGEWRNMAVGTPEYAERARRSSKYRVPTDEEARWITIELRNVGTLALRRGGSPTDVPAKAPAETQGQLALPGLPGGHHG
ncbi:MAG TPA: hypothetical protein VHH11_13940 [Gammaproteobacteria bacterium]|nr:hypothetical protein [Gammaproteobacteria bacterium]